MSNVSSKRTVIKQESVYLVLVQILTQDNSVLATTTSYLAKVGKAEWQPIFQIRMFLYYFEVNVLAKVAVH